MKTDTAPSVVPQRTAGRAARRHRPADLEPPRAAQRLVAVAARTCWRTCSAVVAADRRRRGWSCSRRAGRSSARGTTWARWSGGSEAEYRDLFATCSRVMLGLRRLPQPVIARVQGVATAGGLPARRGLRPGGRGRGGDLRHAGREDRPVLHHADGPAGPGDPRQGGPGDALHRAADLGPARAASWAWSTGSSPATSSTRRSQ